jgi:ATP-dependent 26S proteasome regulatory subunit
VLIVGATLSLKGFDESLRRSGRFEKEVQLEIPNQNERCSIFGQMAADLEYPASLNLDEIKELCF